MTTWIDGHIVLEHATAYDREVVRRYEDATSGIIDCFDLLDEGGADITELRTLSKVLSEWWSAIDSLDADLIESRPEGSARDYLELQVARWVLARTDLVWAIAETAGIEMPRPDYHGYIVTSNRTLGRVGYTADPHLPALLRSVL